MASRLDADPAGEIAPPIMCGCPGDIGSMPAKACGAPGKCGIAGRPIACGSMPGNGGMGAVSWIRALTYSAGWLLTSSKGLSAVVVCLVLVIVWRTVVRRRLLVMSDKMDKIL